MANEIRSRDGKAAGTDLAAGPRTSRPDANSAPLPLKDVALSERSRMSVSKKAIMATAKRIFVECGYKETNLAAVADELGVKRQALYHYFPKKHDILIEIFDQYFEHLEERFAAAAVGKSPGADRFDSMLETYFQAVTEHPQEAALLARELVHLPETEQRSVKLRRVAIHNNFVREFEIGQAAGAFREGPADLMVSLLLGSANWTTRWYSSTESLTPGHLASRARALLAAGYRNATE